MTALLFGGVTALLYLTDIRSAVADAGLTATWPMLVVELVLIATLIAATMIDARLFIIPLSLPWTATAVAIVALPVATAMGWLDTSSIKHLEAVVPAPALADASLRLAASSGWA